MIEDKERDNKAKKREVTFPTFFFLFPLRNVGESEGEGKNLSSPTFQKQHLFGIQGNNTKAHCADTDSVRRQPRFLISFFCHY